MSMIPGRVYELEGGDIYVAPPCPAKLREEAEELSCLLLQTFLATYLGMAGVSGRVTDVHIKASANPNRASFVDKFASRLEYAENSPFVSYLTARIGSGGSRKDPIVGLLKVRHGLHSPQADSPFGEIAEIDVLPEHQKHGIGTVLMHAGLNHIVASARGEHDNNLVRLDVVDENTRAKVWYEKLGFRATGKVVTSPLFAAGSPPLCSEEMVGVTAEIIASTEQRAKWRAIHLI